MTPDDLKEAQAYLKNASAEEQKCFALRQFSARRRLSQLLQFYRRFPCRMARLHLLAACAVVLGRFAGYSPSFNEIGQRLMPVDEEGKFQTPLWQHYAEVCEKGYAWETRDELWLKAHMQDLVAVHQVKLDQSFYEEPHPHIEETLWQLLKQHMEVTLGTRLMDRSALTGAIAYETAMAHSLKLSVLKLFSKTIRLTGFYAFKTLKALCEIRSHRATHLISYRRTAIQLIRYFLSAWTAVRVFRQGIRKRDRGSEASDEGWSLLEEVLQEKVSQVHPDIMRFYRNPSNYHVTTQVVFKTRLARFWSTWMTLLLGQGLYEPTEKISETHFRVFKRTDGSMHFIRELHCQGKRRIFDSDFVIRQKNNHVFLCEVFLDLNIEVEMEVTPLTDGGLSIRAKKIYWRKLRLPRFGIQLEFVSSVKNLREGEQDLQIQGSVSLKPQSAWGKFLAYRIFRRPQNLASIQYLVRPQHLNEVSVYKEE